MSNWQSVLELDITRQITSGSASALRDAIRCGADLRIATEFRHNEHIDTASASDELVREVAEFGVTYLVDDRWAAGIMNLRQPVSLPDRFGPRPSMSFFLYNEDGRQAIARPFLDRQAAAGAPGPSEPVVEQNMPRYHAFNGSDGTTNAPSQNFVYDFDYYRFYVDDSWREVLAHDSAGRVVAGDIEQLAAAFSGGAEVKVAVRGLCAGLGDGPDHEVFIQAGSCYFYTAQRLFLCGTHPLVRVKPAIPLEYESRGWDFGWLLVRTDGQVTYRRCDPYTLEFTDHMQHCAVRWFAR